MNVKQYFREIIKTKQFRIALHVGFWSFYLSLPIFQYFTYTKFSANWIFLITIINIIYVGFYYPYTYYVLPKFFKTNRIHWFVLLTLGFYAVFFYACLLLEKYALAHFTFNNDDLQFLNEAVKRKVYYIPELLQIIIVTAIPLSLKFLRRYYRLQDEKNNLEKLNTNLELNFLKAQLNPHFLFNSLNNIYSLALHKSDKAPEMLIKLSDLMRYMLYECNVEKNSLDKEIAFMKNYIELEKIRHGENAEIQFEVEGNTSNKSIPPLLLIPFVENAFKHGVNAQMGKSWVKFHLTLTETGLRFTGENNKPYNGAAVLKNNGGIGIENTRKRLELSYPHKFSLDINNTNETYKVSVEIPDL